MALHPAIAALKAPESGLGLSKGEVGLAAYNPRWCALFDTAAAVIMQTLDNTDARVEHIGSTSVPGLAAKPLLDIAVGLPEPIDQDSVVASLESIGFEFQMDLGIYGGLLFTVSTGPSSTAAHLHVVDINEFQWRWYLAFRDGLRDNPGLAEEYEAIKRSAAMENPGDRDGYTKAKFDWVLSTVNRLDQNKD